MSVRSSLSKAGRKAAMKRAFASRPTRFDDELKELAMRIAGKEAQHTEEWERASKALAAAPLPNDLTRKERRTIHAVARKTTKRRFR